MSDSDFEQQATEREAAMRGLEPYVVRANRAVSDRLLKEILSDSFRGVSQRSSLAARQLSAEEPRKPSGGTAEVKPPPGINYVDQMCDAQDRLDRAAAVRARIESEWIEKQLERRNQYRATCEYNPFSRERMGHDDE